MPLEFQWSERKAASNLKKHRVAFETAKTVFEDMHARIVYDDEHSEIEDRFTIVGRSDRGRLLFVSFVERGSSVFRIISARVATRLEREDYENRKGHKDRS